MKKLILAALIALWPVAVSAQMHVAVEPDKVRMGAHEFAFRFATVLPNVLVVPAGQTVTLPPDSIHDAIEVAGTLRVARDHSTTVRFIHLMILPGGTLDAGTAADPIPQNVTVTFIIRDMPLDLARDPFQWGNSIANFGTQTRVGYAKAESFVELTDDAPAGALTLNLSSVPEGWDVGDELLLPDMSQQQRNTAAKRDPVTRIVAIDGNTLTVDRPLGFARESVRRPDGSIVLRPRVANLSRNIVIKSENPSGVRGHTANIGHEASWDIRYNQFVGVGRTTFADLNNTTVDMAGNVLNTGANQIGKYANHDHHGGSSLTVRQNVGNSYQGLGGSKWAHAVHGTHDVLVQSNVCVDFQGGCFVTEDGYEVRNIFRGNVAAYSLGNGRGAGQNTQPGTTNNSPGGEGSCFWFRGLQNVIEGNEAWNCNIGINLFNTTHVGEGTLVSSVKGGAPDVVHKPLIATFPISFDGNVTIGNGIGLEHWSTPRFPAKNHTSAHNRTAQMSTKNSQSIHVYLVNPTLIAAGGVSSCITSSVAYVQSLEVNGGELRGCEVAINGGLARGFGAFRNVTLQNVVNIGTAGAVYPIEMENVIHEPLGAFPKRYVVLDNRAPWQPGQPIPAHKPEEWTYQRGSLHLVKNWQGTGQDFQVMDAQSRRDLPAWPALSAGFSYLVPAVGLTNGQAWDTYGMSNRGDTFAASDVVALDGLIGGMARPGLVTPLGPPRVVLTWPNVNVSAPIASSRRGAYTRFQFVLTGQPASDTVRFRVDGGAVQTTTLGFAEGRPVTAGWHVVESWRDGNEGAKLTGCYRVGEVSAIGPKPAACGDGTPPPPPDESCGPNGTGNGIDDDGDGQIDEGCALPPPPPCTGTATLTIAGFVYRVTVNSACEPSVAAMP